MGDRERARLERRRAIDAVAREWQRVRPIGPSYHRRYRGRGAVMRETRLRDDVERLVQYVLVRWPRLPEDRERVADAMIRALAAPKPWLTPRGGRS